MFALAFEAVLSPRKDILIKEIMIDFLPALLPVAHLHVHTVLSVLSVGLRKLKIWSFMG